MPTSSPSERPANVLLAQLPERDFREVARCLTTVQLLPKQILHKQGERLRYVYFPNGGVVSMASLLPDGSMVEVATVGDDGIVGVEALFDDHPRSACETIVQVPVPHDSASRLGIAEFRRLLVTCPAFARAISRYAETLYAVMARLAACNSRHDLVKRCARWLLMTHDRVHRRDFHLSQEFLAVMLGVRRQSVTAASAALRDAGLIDYVHGHVSVLDRRRLEAAACECYPAIRALYSHEGS